MRPTEFLVLVIVGAVAAAINTVAGGGSLISYPVLTLVYRFPSRESNASNSVALWPGSLAGALGYLSYLARTGRYFKVFIGPTILGSMMGAWLLTISSQTAFNRIVPFLILTAAVMLVLQPRIKKRAEQAGGLPTWVGLFIQFLVAIYGGYFGAGMGIMMLGAFALTMEGDIHELNAVKNWLGLFINLIASVVFFLKGMVNLEIALPLMLGCVCGGYASARISQQFNPEKLRLVISIYGFSMAAYYFYSAFIA